MSPNRLSAGKSADCLVYYGLKDRSGQIFFRRPVVNEGLDIRFGKHTAARSNGIERLVIFGIFIQTGRVRLEKRRHLVDKRTGTAGTDAVHSLFDVSALEIDDLGVFSAKFNGNVCLRSIILKSRGHSDDFLDKRNSQVFCEREPAAPGNNRGDMDGAKPVEGAPEKIGQRLLDVCIVAFVVGEEYLVFFIQNRNFNCSGTDIDSESM